MSARGDVGAALQRIVAESCSRVRLRRWQDVNQVVANRALFFEAGFCRAHVHVAIDLRRVHADDFNAADAEITGSRHSLGQCHRQRAFAAGSGAHDEEGRRQRRVRARPRVVAAGHLTTLPSRQNVMGKCL